MDYVDADEEDQPAALLVTGRTYYFRPVPDASYTLKHWGKTQRPTELTGISDAPQDRIWGPYIAYGAAISILGDGGEQDEADGLKDEFAALKSSIIKKQIQQIPLGQRARPRF